ncbi:MAG: hypothetical protein CMJ72_15655 [Planctomycetaceae bacterium]|nr:hypothetical protein [Planctomycetaceae bacterium]MBD16569.1 hypothetical protein [Planctomycetaceae bacterium]
MIFLIYEGSTRLNMYCLRQTNQLINECNPLLLSKYEKTVKFQNVSCEGNVKMLYAVELLES